MNRIYGTFLEPAEILTSLQYSSLLITLWTSFPQWVVLTKKRCSLTPVTNRSPPLWRCGPTRAMASSFLRFLDHTQRRITVGRTPLDEWSPRRRDLYLTTHNTHNRQTSITPAGFEPTISASERPQAYALGRAATETGYKLCNINQ